jgi:geranylgeranyl reductase family protein
VKRVAVVGAGPAGSAAAMSLRQFPGIEVLLLERGTFPRQKPCGSGLSPWALEVLDRMGLGDTIRAGAHPIRAALIGGANLAPVELRGRYEAAIYPRSAFDGLLAREAAQRGADLREGVRVEELVRHAGRLVGIRTSAGRIEVDAAIVSNGASSTLAPADRPGTTLRSIMGWYEGVADASDAVELYFDPPVRPYYGWLFPEHRGRVNIGICYAPTPGGRNARERFQEFVEARFGRRLRGAAQIGRLIGHPIATTRTPTALVQDGTLLAGEAARLVDPATAEGIYSALDSGLMSGHVLGSVLESGRAPSAKNLAPYAEMIHQRLGRRLAAGDLLLKALRTPILDIVLRLGSLRPVRSALTWALAHA